MPASGKKIVQSEELRREIDGSLRKDDDHEAKILCRDFKIQVLPAAFYLNENVNFKQSAASGKMSTQGCCC
ncbi:unnamed protein product [Porites evermanni]|uniref:Uncharacterized protein n=1 Tax=Porites evermanni TaxID=104178 RepID=A0ABN8MF25_9CNID|nr:unnamed protein product [Porites evermanni]